MLRNHVNAVNLVPTSTPRQIPSPCLSPPGAAVRRSAFCYVHSTVLLMRDKDPHCRRKLKRRSKYAAIARAGHQFSPNQSFSLELACAPITDLPARHSWLSEVQRKIGYDGTGCNFNADMGSAKWQNEEQLTLQLSTNTRFPSRWTSETPTLSQKEESLRSYNPVFACAHQLADWLAGWLVT